MRRQRHAAWVVLIGLTAFNAWHSQYRGIWNPVSVIGSLNLSADRVERLRTVDPSLRSNGSYDGQFFYLIALDPLLVHKTWLPLFSDPVYRYQRALYPLLAHAAALGRARALPYSLLGINVLFFLVGGWAVHRLARRNGWSRWVLAGYLANTGLIFCVFRTLAEPVAMALCLAGILAWRGHAGRLKRALGAGCFALGVLAREPFVIVPLSVAAWEWIAEKRSLRRAAALVIATVLPFLIWLSYLHVRLPSSPPYYHAIDSGSIVERGIGFGRLSIPFVGIVQESLSGLRELSTSTEVKRTLSLSAVAIALCVWAAVTFSRRPSFWGFLCLTQAGFVSVLRGDIWNYHAGSARVLITLFVFATMLAADEIAANRLRSGRTLARGEPPR